MGVVDADSIAFARDPVSHIQKARVMWRGVSGEHIAGECHEIKEQCGAWHAVAVTEAQGQTCAERFSYLGTHLSFCVSPERHQW